MIHRCLAGQPDMKLKMRACARYVCPLDHSPRLEQPQQRREVVSADCHPSEELRSDSLSLDRLRSKKKKK